MVHNFTESLERGERFEQLLDQHFSQWFSVETVTMEFQRLGIDRIFTKQNGQRFTVEYKTDERAHETGNIFVETVSVKKGETVEKLGWAHTSTAQLLVYYVPGIQRLYIVDMLALRDKLDKWSKQHRTAQADNGGYVGEGLLVPLQKLEKLCRGVQNVTGHVLEQDAKQRTQDRQQDLLRELGY